MFALKLSMGTANRGYGPKVRLIRSHYIIHARGTMHHHLCLLCVSLGRLVLATKAARGFAFEMYLRSIFTQPTSLEGMFARGFIYIMSTIWINQCFLNSQWDGVTENKRHWIQVVFFPDWRVVRNVTRQIRKQLRIWGGRISERRRKHSPG
jgi:hypothetical protein